MLQIFELVRNSVDHQKALFPPGDSGLLLQTERPPQNAIKKKKNLWYFFQIGLKENYSIQSPKTTDFFSFKLSLWFITKGIPKSSQCLSVS